MLTSPENSIKYHALSPAVPYLGGGKDALRKKCRVFVLPFLENFANNTMQPIKRKLNATCFGFCFLGVIIYLGLSMFDRNICKIEVYTNIRRHVQKRSGSPPIGIICSQSLESKLFSLSIIR